MKNNNQQSQIKPEVPKNVKKRGTSFKEVPTFTKYIDMFKNFKENSLDKKDDLVKKLPKSLRYLKPSPMQSFFILMGVSGFFTYKTLLGILFSF